MVLDQKYERRYKENQPVVAICYDFDKTLSPDDMQAQGFIQSVGYEHVPDFWKKSNALADENEMDQNLAYMFTMKQEAEGSLLFTKTTLIEYGEKVQLFPGVEEWSPVWKRAGRHCRALHHLVRPEGNDRGHFRRQGRRFRKDLCQFFSL